MIQLTRLNDDLFTLNACMIEQIQSLPDTTITLINGKKIVVKEKINEFQRNTGKEYMFLESYEGTFSLQGDVSDLRDIYALGVSLRRSQGFGMIEVI